MYEITWKNVYEIGKDTNIYIYLKGYKDSKKIEKYKEICSSFDILGSIRTFKNITTCKMFILKKFQFGFDF